MNTRPVHDRCIRAAAVLCLVGAVTARAAGEQGVAMVTQPDCKVHCANLVYGENQTSKCFSDQFLDELESRTHIRTHAQFVPIGLEETDLFLYPFAVMSGEKAFNLNRDQRANLRHYVLNGGFLVASAGCSSQPWRQSFVREFKAIFPDRKMVKLTPQHPVFHTVNDVSKARYKQGSARFPDLYGLEIDGTIRMIYSPDGLNDTGNAGKGCCCCGGNEIKDAIWINMNLLAFALTH